MIETPIAASVDERSAAPDRPTANPDAATALFDVMSTTRAIRHLSPEPVPEETIRALVQAAVWAPTGSNEQGQAYVVVTDRRQIERLAALWRQVIEDFRVANRVAGTTATDPSSLRIRDATDHQRDHFEETPVVIVACYDMSDRRRAARDPRVGIGLLRAVGPRRWFRLARGSRAFTDRSEAASVYPGVENLLLAARALGLGACLTTWHLLAEAELKAILGIPREVNTFAVIPVGWPLRPFGPVKRGVAEDAIHRDRW